MPSETKIEKGEEKKKKKGSKFKCRRAIIKLTKTSKSNREYAADGDCRFVSSNFYLEVKCICKVFRAHFLKAIFSESDMLELKEAIYSCPSKYWEIKSDKRGYRRFLYSGFWNAQGQKKIYGAGKAGKLELDTQTPILRSILKRLGEKATELVLLKRPDVYISMKEAGKLDNEFGIFHMFMSPAGGAGMHKDNNDYISCIFKIHQEQDTKGGGLEIGGAKICFNLKVGDVVIMDSDSLWHGTRGYQGNEVVEISSKTDRLMGIFLIHRTFAGILGVERDDLVREDYKTKTVPMKQ
jgi:hypothetical protein